MNYQDAVQTLSACNRAELRDHAFGDREISWWRGDTLVAEGYDGVSAYVVCSDGTKFENDEAYKLFKLGTLKTVTRNDAQGD